MGHRDIFGFPTKELKGVPGDPHPVRVINLLDAIRAGGDIDIIRRGAELVLQALIEPEATETIDATRYERSEPHQADFFRSKSIT